MKFSRISCHRPLRGRPRRDMARRGASSPTYYMLVCRTTCAWNGGGLWCHHLHATGRRVQSAMHGDCQACGRLIGTSVRRLAASALTAPASQWCCSEPIAHQSLCAAFHFQTYRHSSVQRPTPTVAGDRRVATCRILAPRNHVLDGGAHWRHLANAIERSVHVHAMSRYCLLC